MRAASVSPETSSAGLRVSDTVMIAIRTGTNACVSSIRWDVVILFLFGDGRRGRGSGLPRRLVGGPAARSRFRQCRRIEPQPPPVHPVIGQQPLDVEPRF